jgi:hypothetical protein
MVASIKFSGFSLRAGPIVGALLPFVLMLFLLPEPTELPVEDYFPSSRARTITVKIIKSLKSCPNESASAASRDFAVGGIPQSITICQAAIDAELHIHLRHFSLLTNRLVRSPPGFSL